MAISTQAKGAKNIKRELQRVFPGVKFSVRSSCFAGGNAIDVSWTLGPTVREVEVITSAYQDGHFDGMIDLYEYNHSEAHKEFRETNGCAKYVQTDRELPEELREKIGRDLCRLQRVEYTSLDARGLCGERDTLFLSDYVWQLFSETSWKGEYAGIEFATAEDSYWCKIIFK